jgi:hypothetical protein
MIQAGELPERRAYLRAYLTEVREGLVNDLGPLEEDLTTAQAVLIDRVISKLSILRCVEEHVREKGVFTKAGELGPVLSKSYLAWANSIRLDLQALGINTRAGERILGPLEIAAEIDREQAEQDAREAAEKAALAGERPRQVAQDRLSPEDSPDTTGGADDAPGEEIDNEGDDDNG